MRNALNGIVRNVEGALAAIIMAYDGIAIDEVTQPQSGFDLQLLTVEYASVLKEIKRAIEVIKVGDLEEVCITTGHLLVVMRVLSDELFVVLIMSKDGNFGKGRYLMRLKSVDLLRELA